MEPAKQQPRPRSKWSRILTALVQGRRLTRFDAERLGDHTLNTTMSVLNTTMSVLRRRHGIHVEREVVVVDGAFGKFWCARYWLTAPERDRARQLLGTR